MNQVRSKGRITFLDGVRGVAAFIVIVSHLIAGFFPALYFGAEGAAGAAAMDAVANSPLFVFYSGTFAVYVFFVLSGYVMSASADKTANGLPMLILTRYLRLTVPIACSVLLALVLSWFFSGAPQRAAAIVGHWWLGFLYQPMSLPWNFVAREAFFNVYWTGLSYYNNVLWTMRVEFAGSVAIYALYLGLRGRLRRLRVPVLVLAALAACFATREWPSNLLGFFLGGLIYEFKTRQGPDRSGLLGAALFCAGVLLGGLPFNPTGATLYAAIFAYADRFCAAFGSLRALAAAALIMGVFLWDASRNLFDSRAAQFLGRISFALYLVHLPLLCFGFAQLYLYFGSLGVWPMALSIVGYLAAALATAYAFTILIDEPTVRALSRAKKWTAGRRGGTMPVGGRPDILSLQSPSDSDFVDRRRENRR